MIGGQWGNLDEALRSIRALGEEVGTEQVLAPALLAGGRELRDNITQVAPRSNVAPHMADTFVVKLSKEQADFGRTVVLVGPSTGRTVGFVAPFVEFGTSEQAAQPFVRPEADSFILRFPGLMADNLRRVFSRVVRKYTKGVGR